jgi:molybdopterin-guanine dinucleotide biosynthesis protein A
MQDASKEPESPEDTLTDTAGVVLAGGRSSRFGRNKALAELGGVPLIQRVVGVLKPVFRHVYIITNSPREYAFLGLPMFQDLIRGLGPLGGIYTALRSMPESRGFFAACDMPNLNGRLIRHMADQARDMDAVVPRIRGMVEALHAVYGSGCLPAIQALIDSQCRQVFRFFDGVAVRYLEEEELRRYDPALKSFFNINTPDDLESGAPGKGIQAT